MPGIVEQLRAEAPARFEAVRNTDPKDVQEKAAGRAKEAQAVIQAKVNEVLGTLDTDLKKIGETAQDLALRGVGVAAEYAVKARETYEKVAEHGEETVRAWRGEAADEILEVAEAVEPEAEPVAVADERAAAKPQPADASATKPVAAKKAPAKKTTTVKKSTPSAK